MHTYGLVACFLWSALGTKAFCASTGFNTWGTASRSTALKMGLTAMPQGESSMYPQIYKQCDKALQLAIKDGKKFLEVEFPSSLGLRDKSLGKTQDNNYVHTRELARPFTPNKGKKLWLIFPENGEATLFKKRFGETPFTITSIEDMEKKKESDEYKNSQLHLVVNPGFNVDEYLKLEGISSKDKPMIILNGNLDRVRSGYYPRIFYPGLYKAKERFLGDFEEIYYLKQVGYGWLFRCYPEDWQIIGGGPEPKVIETSAQRPEYNYADKKIKSSFR